MCHQGLCTLESHLFLEPILTNFQRNKCLHDAINMRKVGTVIPQHCSKHELPCLVREAALHREEYLFRAFVAAHGIMMGDVLSQVTSQTLLGYSDGFRLSSASMFTIRPRLCVPSNCLKRLFTLIHQNNHIGYARMHALIITSFYVWRLKFHLRAYFLHCPPCLVFQTRRHSPCRSPQPIETPPSYIIRSRSTSYLHYRSRKTALTVSSQ